MVLGYNASNTSDGHWQDVGSASDFFNTPKPVYTGSPVWDFTNPWLATGVIILIFSSLIISGLAPGTGLLPPTGARMSCRLQRARFCLTPQA